MPAACSSTQSTIATILLDPTPTRRRGRPCSTRCPRLPPLPPLLHGRRPVHSFLVTPRHAQPAERALQARVQELEAARPVA